jgi:(1->4)-alpha-D-glucan 1-alpha-D-glucosylmutase
MSIPRATARLQFHKDFTLDAAINVIDYYKALGISHIYASPLLTARSGSMHGYDVVDPTRINPELGGEQALRRFVACLREANMGLIIDIVPNHMGVSSENPWWQHILEWGRQSPYAGWFDIDWQSNDIALRGKVLAPFLGQPYGDALSAAEITLQFDAENGKIFAGYFSHRFPLAPSDYAAILLRADSDELAPVIAAFEKIATADSSHIQLENADNAFVLLKEISANKDGAAAIEKALAAFSAKTPEGMDALHQLLEKQHYRLSWWRNAAEEINWRRFFEVSDLIGVRVEQEGVFEATHELIFRLYAEGLIDGVRIDHIDGLADPGDYCRKLRERLQLLASQRPAGLPRDEPYIIVEKILAAGEQLRKDWGVDGTTGYEFMDQVGALLHDPAGTEPLAQLRAEISGAADDFQNEVKSARRQLLAENLVGEFEAAARTLHAIARADLHTRDFSLATIRRVLTELLVHFQVYRTYAGEEGRDPLDQQIFDHASKLARQSIRPADWPVLELLDKWLGGEPPYVHAQLEVRNLCRRAITRFQQLTPPLAAKSVEDTAFYRYGRLLSRNEVGADPGQFSLDTDQFHQLCQERALHFPHTLLATATHDHKRGEDVRARLAVLSEIPQQWANMVRRWAVLNAPLCSEISSGEGLPSLRAPQPDDELMLYQMLVGAWPLGLAADDPAGVQAFAERIDQWQTKALREAKSASSWVKPNEPYEIACRNFLHTILKVSPINVFLTELVEWVRRISSAGAVNGLTQTVLRLSSPGVPDLYQGTDFWDFSLVDPDNRRPVDYALRRHALADAPPFIKNMNDWESGQLKQQIIQHGLHLRQREPLLFLESEYIPLKVEGPLSNHIVAFMRRYQDRFALTIVTRLPTPLIGANTAPVIAKEIWENTAIVSPSDMPTNWHNIFTGEQLALHDERLLVSDALATLPVAILVPAR